MKTTSAVMLSAKSALQHSTGIRQFPRVRKRHPAFHRAVAWLIMVVCSLVGASAGFSQTYGPPQIDYYGTLLPFQASDEQGSDVYTDGMRATAVIDADRNVTVNGIGEGDYNAATQTFQSWSGMVAVGSDGVTLLGVPAGVIVYTNNPDGGSFVLSEGGSQYSPDYRLDTANGFTVFKYVSVPANYFFQIAGSPWYQYSGAGDFVLDTVQAMGWPGSNVPSAPSGIYVNGNWIPMNGLSQGGGGTEYWSNGTYWDGSNSGSVSLSADGSGWISGTFQGMNFSTSYDPSDSYYPGLQVNPPTPNAPSPPNGFYINGRWLSLIDSSQSGSGTSASYWDWSSASASLWLNSDGSGSISGSIDGTNFSTNYDASYISSPGLQVSTPPTGTPPMAPSYLYVNGSAFWISYSMGGGSSDSIYAYYYGANGNVTLFLSNSQANTIFGYVDGTWFSMNYDPAYSNYPGLDLYSPTPTPPAPPGQLYINGIALWLNQSSTSGNTTSGWYYGSSGESATLSISIDDTGNVTSSSLSGAVSGASFSTSYDPTASLSPGIVIPPNQIYLNGTYMWLTGSSGGGIGTTAFYTNNNDSVTMSLSLDPALLILSGTISGTLWGEEFSCGYSPSCANYPGISVTFHPKFGPPQISWNGVTLAGSYDPVNHYDAYAGSGMWIVIDQGGSVSIMGPYSTGGSYDSEFGQFNFGNDWHMSNFLALNSNGDPLAISSGDPNDAAFGVTMYFGGYAYGRAILGTDGRYWTPTYTFRRADNSWGVKYVGLPDGYYFVVQDNTGGFNSPVYRYTASNGDFVINTVAYGWPASNVYPRQLYFNGQPLPLDAGTVSTWGTVQNGGGAASYHPENSADPTVTLTWTFNNGFSAVVGGSYGAFQNFSGSWDGAKMFNGLPGGVVITVDAPPASPRYGPSQIAWNGVTLSFDPVASSVSATNPQGADIYRDSSGLSFRIVIGSDRGAILYKPDGSAPIAGTYDTASYQFNFSGQNVGIIAAVDSNGTVMIPPSLFGGGPGGTTGSKTMELLGNLDVHGNIFSLGSWLDGSGNSLNAFTISFSNALGSTPSLLNLSTTRQSMDWIWSHADADGSSNQITTMKLDSRHRLILYDPANPISPTIILDPGGKSHIEPQGDLSMGEFTQQPQ
jgi:hypothetical protein